MDLMSLAVGKEYVSNHGVLPMAPKWPHIVAVPSLAMEDNATQKNYILMQPYTQRWEPQVAIIGHWLFKQKIVTLLGVGCVNKYIYTCTGVIIRCFLSWKISCISKV